MKRLHAILIGLGQIGCGYDLELPFQIDRPRSGMATLSHARALACHPQVQLLAGLDPIASARESFSRCYDLPSFSDLAKWHQAMPDVHVDLVVLAVPPVLQPSIVEALLNRISPRLLLLEKPVAVSIVEGDKIRNACGRHPEMEVAVNYIRRYLPAVSTVNQRLRSGAYGSLLHGRVVYGKGLLSNGSHFVNLAESWLGPLQPHSCVSRGEVWAGFDSESTVILRAPLHHNAAFLVQSIGQAGLRAGELDLWFSEGRVRWENDGTEIALWPLGSATPGDSHRSLAIKPERFSTDIEHYQHVVLESLVKVLLKTSTTPLGCNLQEGLTTLKILESARDASD